MMRANLHYPTCWEMVDGERETRNPLKMTEAQLAEAGHERCSPMALIRAKCLQCSGDSPTEARYCRVTSCPIWPLRMGKNPWRAPMSEEQRQVRREVARKTFGSPKSPVNLRTSGAADPGPGILPVLEARCGTLDKCPGNSGSANAEAN
jgi:hypothetical protein